MPDPKIRTQSTFPTTLMIDGQQIAVRVKRMTNTEYDAYIAGLDRLSVPRGPEETPEARRVREAECDAWLRQALDDYLSIVPGEMEHDGREVTKGGELPTIYGGRTDVVPQALALVAMENHLTDAEKKSSRLRLASLAGSASGLPATDTGAGPAPTAAVAAPPDSAPAAAVMGDAGAKSSGMTAPSSCGAALSAR